MNNKARALNKTYPVFCFSVNNPMKIDMVFQSTPKAPNAHLKLTQSTPKAHPVIKEFNFPE
jgi:hypothetical protein